MRITTRLLILGFILSLPVCQLFADEPVTGDPPDSSRVVYTLDEVVVYGSDAYRVPVAVQNIPTVRIVRQNVNSLADIMKFDPGLTIASGRKNSSDMHIRGANSQSILMLVDGHPLNTGYRGEADLSMIPVSQIERIQIIKGPASVAYGANSLGGIVNIVTRGGAELPPSVSFQNLFGDLGHRELSGSAGGSIGAYSGWISVENLTWNGTPLSSDFNSEGLEDGGNRDNSDLERRSLNLKVARSFLKRGYLSLMLGFTQAEKGLPGSVYRPGYWRFTDYSRRGGNMSFLYNPGFNIRLKSSFFANSYDDELIRYKDESLSPDNIKFDSQLRSLTIGGSFEAEWDGLDNHLISSGVKISSDKTQRKTDKDEPWTESSNRTISLYMEDELFIYPDILLTAGVGSYHYFMKQTDRSISSLGYMAGISRRWFDDYTTRFSAARSIFFPTQHNLYSSNRGNPDLKPEQTLKYEMSLEGEKRLLGSSQASLGLTLFYQQTEDQIDLSPDQPFAEARFINIHHIDSWGLETTFNLQAGRNLEFECAASLIDWRTDSGTILDSPHLKLNGRMHIVTLFETEGNFEAVWFGEREAIDVNGDTIDMASYMVVNGNISRPLNRWVTLRLAVRNIFDADYEEIYGYPGQGRKILGGLRVMVQ